MEEEIQKNAGPEETGNWKQSVVLYIHDLMYTLIAIMIVFLVVFRVIVVNGSSMYDTLIHGDYVLLLSNVFYQEPQAGDIVVIAKESFDDGKPIIKRVIATEGQTVDIDFEQGTVYVDGVALQEDYTHTPTNLDEGMQFPLTVEENCIFVMGDNRNKSLDSRHPAVGQVDCREIMGKALFLCFPGRDEEKRPEFDRIGVIK